MVTKYRLSDGMVDFNQHIPVGILERTFNCKERRKYSNLSDKVKQCPKKQIYPQKIVNTKNW